MSTHPDLDALARRVLDANRYVTLATLDPDGRPRLSPVYYTPARNCDLYWVSSPDAHHSRNLTERPQLELVVFDSSVPVGGAEALYASATAREIGEAELEDVVGEAFRPAGGARAFAPDELRGAADLRLYVASMTACEVLVRGGDPVWGRGVDTRVPATPWA
jgi:hypothetical protein